MSAKGLRIVASAVGIVPSLVAITSLLPGVKPKKALALVSSLWPKRLLLSAVKVLLLLYTSSPELAVLPLTVELVRITVYQLSIPPPKLTAVFPLTVELVRVMVPE